MATDLKKIDWKKFGLSFFQAEPWIKNARFIIGAILILLIAYMVKQTFFAKPTQTQNNDITVQSGGTLNVIQKTDVKKRAWYLPHIFGELYGFAEYDTTERSRVGVGTRGGLRWEW